MYQTWGIDVSDWQDPNRMDIALMAQNGLVFVIAKSSMGFGTAKRHRMFAQKTKDAGAKIGLYHWVDPTATIDGQFKYFASEIDAIKPDFIACDNEQWWSNWAMYNAYIRGAVSVSDVPKLTSRQISECGYKFMHKVHDAYPNLMLYNYTARWVINGYSPDMTKWINDFPLWQAAYIVKSGGITYVQLAEVLEHLGQPQPIANSKGWRIWQISSGLMLPGYFSSLDIDITPGTKEEFYAEISSGSFPPPPPADNLYRVTAFWLTVRDSPYGGTWRKTGRYLKLGTIVNVLETSNNWGRIGPGEWVSMTWLKKK